jgi:hypothetical protein
MKITIVLILFFVALFDSVAPSYATEKFACVGASFAEVRSLAELPQEVSALLGKERKGPEGIADQGGKFNKTDVVIDNLPMRRFSLAAVSADCILVAVERGGRGYFVELLAFEHNNTGWHAGKRQSVNSVPRSLQELVDRASK